MALAAQCRHQVRVCRQPPGHPGRRGPRHSGDRIESPRAPHARIGRSKAWRQPSSDGGLPRTKHPSGVKGYRVKLPIGVGFGIRDAATAKAVAKVADAVVIGSRIIQEIEAAPAGEAPRRVAAWLATIREAVDQVAKRAA